MRKLGGGEPDWHWPPSSWELLWDAIEDLEDRMSRLEKRMASKYHPGCNKASKAQNGGRKGK
jgi:hypothetical protein